MNRNLDFYIDRARSNKGFKSDLELGRHLGFKGSAVSFWRVGKAFPSDETMVQLAALAGVDPAIALLDLNAWRSGGAAREAYNGMLKRLVGAGIVAALTALFVVFPPDDGHSAMAAGLALPKIAQHYDNYTLSHRYILDASRRALSIRAAIRDFFTSFRFNDRAYST